MSVKGVVCRANLMKEQKGPNENENENEQQRGLGPGYG
jgi:hypothetical protein